MPDPRIKSATFFQKQNNVKTAKNEVTKSEIEDSVEDRFPAPGFGTDFVFTVLTSLPGETVQISCQDEGVFNATITQEDGTESTITSFNDPDLLLTFPEPGVQVVRISGQFPNIHFNNAGDASKVRQVIQLGDVGWVTLENAFYGCNMMTAFTAGVCDTSAVQNFSSMLRSCTELTTCNVFNLDTTAATTFLNMFRDLDKLTILDVSNLDFNGVTGCSRMFQGCNILSTLDLGTPDVSTVQNFRYMFADLPALNSLAAVASFNTVAATNMESMFENCAAIDIDPSGWNVDGVTNFTNFLTGATIATDTYDDTIVNWSAQTLTATLTADFGNSIYTADAVTWAAREVLRVTYSWTINDGGAVPQLEAEPTLSTLTPDVNTTLSVTASARGTPTVTVNYQWQADGADVAGANGTTFDCLNYAGQTINCDVVPSNSLGDGEPLSSNETDAVLNVSSDNDFVIEIAVPAGGDTFTFVGDAGTYSGTIDWGDGGALSTITSNTDPDLGRFLPEGTYRITLSGTFTTLNWDDGAGTNASAQMVTKVIQLGSIGWTNFTQAFRGCRNLTEVTFAPCDLSGVVNANSAFRQCLALETIDFTGCNFGANVNLGNFLRDTPLLTNVTGIGLVGSNGFTSATECFTNCGAQTDITFVDWDITSASNLTNFFSGTAVGMTTTNYNATLASWAAQSPIPTGLTADFGSVQYSSGGPGEAGRNTLTGAPNNWTINDGGLDAGAPVDLGDDFVLNVRTTTPNETVTIQCQDDGVFNATIDDGNGNSNSVLTFDSANLALTYPLVGDYQVRIRGDFPNIYMNNSASAANIISVEQMGRVNMTRLDYAFFGCVNMTSFTSISNDGTPNVTTMQGMFRDCSAMTTCDIVAIDTGSVTDYSEMFWGCAALTSLDLSSFKVDEATTLQRMFLGCTLLATLDVAAWDVSLVQNFSSTFKNCPALTSLNVTSWNTVAATNMNSMFSNCGAPDINPSGFLVALVTDLVDFLDSSSITQANYDATIVNWAAQTLQNSVSVDFGSSQYSAGGVVETDRASIISTYSWTIVDGGSTGGTGGNPNPSVTQYLGSTAVSSLQSSITATGARGYVSLTGGLTATFVNPTQTIYISERPGAKSSGVSTATDPLNVSAGMAAYAAAAPSGSNVNIEVSFERGYDYNSALRLKANNVGGISQTQPLRITSFGNGSLPKFNNVTTWGGSQKGFVYMSGIHIADNLLINNAIGEHLRIENCEFSEEGMLAIQGSSINNRVRNVTLFNNYHHDIARDDLPSGTWDLFSERIQGLYFFAVSGMTVEDCLFDQIAWKEGYNANESAGPMPPSKWSHGVYNTTGNEDITYNGCIFSRCSSFGLQTRSGSDVYNCLFVDNNIVSNPSGDYSSTNADNGNWSTFAGNVFLRPSTKTAANIGARGRGIAPDNKLLLLDNVAVGNDDGFDVWLVSNGNTPASDDTIVDGWGNVSSQNVPGGVTTPYELPASFYTNLRADWTTTRDQILEEAREFYGLAA